jgi:DNA repair photolyase
VDPAFRPAWDHRPAAEQAALARYFLPHNSAKPQLAPTRPRKIKWYCPFACQSHFPTGHRYCINAYTGCSYGCVYCYARFMQRFHPHDEPWGRFVDVKVNAAEVLAREVRRLTPGPVFTCSACDGWQSVERHYGLTRRCCQLCWRQASA